MASNLSYAQLKAARPDFFRPAKGAPRPTPSLGDLENAQAYRRGRVVNMTKAPKQAVQKSKVIEPGTVL